MTTRQPADQIDLEAALELKTIYFIESSSRRWNCTPGENETPPEKSSLQLLVLQSVSEEKISVRSRLTVKTPQALLIADAAAVYEVKPEAGDSRNLAEDGRNRVEPDDDALRAFAENVGVPTIFPFLREAIYGGAQKIGAKTPVIDILRRGNIELSPTDGP
ncbi:hypothetical protein [Sphaerisporangium sp. NPDC051011]|uniref:hypothetical protein n=1 Tax=Sphaerisporangium sp. NPDC051011 TaxID=3155792 RepID=UPI0033C243B3